MNRKQALFILSDVMDSAKTDTHNKNLIVVPGLEEYSKEELMEHEYETLGYYLRDNPLDRYKLRLSQLCSSKKMQTKSNGDSVAIGGRIIEAKEHQTKKGASMMFLKLEDLLGKMEVVVFPGVFNKFKGILLDNKIIEVEGKIESSSYQFGDQQISENKVFAFKIQEIQDVGKIESIVMFLDDDGLAGKAKEIMFQHPGDIPVTVLFDKFELKLPDQISLEGITELEKMVRLERKYEDVGQRAKKP